jgi:hypothetical protein
VKKQEAGLEIDGRLYPIPTSFTIGEARGIKQITGMAPPEFSDALGDLSETMDPDVFAAFVWIAMHREDPSVTIEAVDNIDFENVVPVGEESEPSPPDEPAGEGEPAPSPAPARSSKRTTATRA